MLCTTRAGRSLLGRGRREVEGRATDPTDASLRPGHLQAAVPQVASWPPRFRAGTRACALHAARARSRALAFARAARSRRARGCAAARAADGEGPRATARAPASGAGAGAVLSTAWSARPAPCPVRAASRTAVHWKHARRRHPRDMRNACLLGAVIPELCTGGPALVRASAAVLRTAALRRFAPVLLTGSLCACRRVHRTLLISHVLETRTTFRQGGLQRRGCSRAAHAQHG